MSTPVNERTSQSLLLYDGTCGFCARSVQFVLRHEGRRRTLRFASLQGAVGTEIRGRHPELASVDSLIWYEPATDHLLYRSEAVLAVATYLGGIWKFLAALGHILPRPVRDATYDLVARNRHSLGVADSCLLPTPEQRTRFVDPDFA
jgi:predicted DCC family thiol-disulfide oxidoreductase YuxK